MTEERQWTAGPWRVQPHAKLGPTQMYWINENTSVGSNNEADAHMAAASPRLYEALEEAREALLPLASKTVPAGSKYNAGAYAFFHREIERAEQALAKIDAALAQARGK